MKLFSSFTLVIVALINGINIGDDANVRAVVEMIANTDKKIKIHYVNKVSDEIFLDKQKRYLVVGSGVKSVPELSMIKQKYTNINLTTLWSGHMMFDNLKQKIIKGDIDITILPKYQTLSDNLVNSVKKNQQKIIQTLLLPSLININDFKLSYLRSRPKIPKLNEKVMLIMIGGDVTLASGNIVRFTPDQARNLAKLFVQIADGRKLFILNGPRTGKYNSNGQMTSSHRNNGDIKIDLVTRAFLDVIEQHNIKYQFVNFVFDRDKIENMYKALVYYAANAANVNYYVPGESITMITEAIKLLPSDKIFVYQHGAMQPIHYKNIELLYNHCLISLIDNNYNIKQRKKQCDTNENNDSDITGEILKFITNK